MRSGTLTLLLYFGSAAWLLLCWMPRFLDLNAGTEVAFGFRYAAATGIPLAVLLLCAAYRQARFGRFSPGTLFQVAIAAALLVMALMVLYATRPSTVLSFLHVLVCGLLILWMLFRPAGKRAPA